MAYNIPIVAIVIIIIFTSSCSILDRTVYRPSINQGNYFTAYDISKIHIGMNKSQVRHILGTSIINDPFSSNIWYYVLRYDFNHKLFRQQTLSLIFNNKNILIHIDNKLILGLNND